VPGCGLTTHIKVTFDWLKHKAIADSRLCPQCATHDEYFRYLSLSKMWLESRLLCSSCSIDAYEYTRHIQGSTIMRYTNSYYITLHHYMTLHGAIVWKHDVIHKTGSAQRIATPSEDGRCRQNAQKIWWNSATWFPSYAAGGQRNIHNLITI